LVFIKAFPSSRGATARSSEGVTPMHEPTGPVPRRRFLGLVLSGAGLVAWSIAGCGTSENRFELTEEARKSVMASKVGDPSKFVKPGKSRVGKR
jgi:hypothetical protein